MGEHDENRVTRRLPTPEQLAAIPTPGLTDAQRDTLKAYEAAKVMGEQITALRAEVERLREALRPFAALAREIEFHAKQMGVEPDAFAKACTWPDLTAARAALEDSNV